MISTLRGALFLLPMIFIPAICSAQFKEAPSLDSAAVEKLMRDIYFQNGTHYLIKRDSTRMGEIASVDSDMIHLGSGARPVAILDPDFLGILSIQGNSGKGALIGVGIGLVAAVYSYFYYKKRPDDGTPFQAAAFAFSFFGLPAIGFGALIGSSIKTETFYPATILK